MTLDEQTATALGWKNGKHDGTLWTRQGHIATRGAPDFSANWHRVQEMLDWLRVRGVVHVVFCLDSVSVSAERFVDGRCMAGADGATLPDALARLVVLVDTWEKGEEAKP